MKRLILLLLLFSLVLPVNVRAQVDPTPRGIVWIPAIGLSRYIQTAPIITIDGVQTNDLRGLGDGVAWMEGTGWIDNRLWRMGLAGHNPGAFERLGELEQGNAVYLITDAGLWRYVVIERVIIDAGAGWVLGSSDRPSLALVTCWGDRRLVVIAERTDER